MLLGGLGGYDAAVAAEQMVSTDVQHIRNSTSNDTAPREYLELAGAAGTALSGTLTGLASDGVLGAVGGGLAGYSAGHAAIPVIENDITGNHSMETVSGVIGAVTSAMLAPKRGGLVGLAT